MTIQFSRAEYVNPDHSAALVYTAEDGPVLVTPDDAETWAEVLAVGAAEFVPPPPTPTVSVTQRQARRALRAAGKLAMVQQAIAAMPGDAGEDARIDWDHAATIERASPLVAAMGALLGMDDEALDELFRQAAAI